MNTLSLFTSIGALDLGLERAGARVVAQVERDPLRRSILARHWPSVPRHDDVNTFPAWWEQEVRPDVELVAGGPPCQPFSRSGLGLGISDDRWQWPAMAAAVRLVRPRWVLLENVPGLLDYPRAFGRILADLAGLGFDAEWSLLSACALGAPHPRPRLFLVAHTDGVDGGPGVGVGQELRLSRREGRAPAGQSGGAAARAWRDRVDGAVAAAGGDDRNADGLAGRLVAAGGDAVVVPVAEYVGRLIMGARDGC